MEEKKSTFKHEKTKKRYWTFVLYPESAPKDWREILQRTGLEIAVSPLHDKDINPGTEEIKKPHYHLILCYTGPVTGNTVKSLVVDALNQPIPLPIDSVRGLYRYFTHKDNPEKYQYDESDITTINGFNILNFADLSSADKTKIKLELVKFIIEKNICEYSDFIIQVMKLNKDDYFFIASTQTIFFNAFIKSKKYKTEKVCIREQIVDKDTGEILSTDEYFDEYDE